MKFAAVDYITPRLCCQLYQHAADGTAAANGIAEGITAVDGIAAADGIADGMLQPEAVLICYAPNDHGVAGLPANGAGVGHMLLLKGDAA